MVDGIGHNGVNGGPDTPDIMRAQHGAEGIPREATRNCISAKIMPSLPTKPPSFNC